MPHGIQNSQQDSSFRQLKLSRSALKRLIDENTLLLENQLAEYLFIIEESNKISHMPFLIDSEKPETRKNNILKLMFYVDFLQQALVDAAKPELDVSRFKLAILRGRKSTNI